MHFGITLKPDLSVDRLVDLTRQAEAAGFGYGWIFDSHVLWKDPYPLLTLMATNTRKMRLGPCVTNPRVRDLTVTASLLATLNIISGGRMDLGIGRGDSSRRVLGKKPTTVAYLGEFVQEFRDLTAGREVAYDGQPTSLTWATGAPPVWIAGYGPKVLNLAGKTADGIILQFADPDLISWCLDFVREGAEEAGRDFASIEVMAAAPVWVSSDLNTARERVRWFPALVSNHIIDLISRYKPEDLPPALTSFVRDRGGYDYKHHCVVGSDNAGFVSDEVVDRFCLVGPAAAHLEKLHALKKAGVTQFNIYLMCGDEEDTLTVYGRDVLPKFA
ncbi:MAG: TIGR03842 family LLM class F420-dependent oxidoreductase [Terriglobales bacterium]